MPASWISSGPPSKRKLIISENTRQLRKLEVLISASRHTAYLLMRELEIPARKISVIHNHLDPMFPAAHGTRSCHRPQPVSSGRRIRGDSRRESQRL